MALAGRNDILADQPAIADTVRAYADTGYSVSACARRLHIHPGTAAYRLERWRTFTGLTGLREPPRSAASARERSGLTERGARAWIGSPKGTESTFPERARTRSAREPGELRQAARLAEPTGWRRERGHGPRTSGGAHMVSRSNWSG
ncbi:helix-turn-helix domain-containing protein [Streptomyces sp. NPDC052236]|uniref:helix-turn-helix domain-containing protein n=1 Tax=Streptomyces sp. NPDC052236 TaxID=3365686 RepID=UPI0037D57937